MTHGLEISELQDGDGIRVPDGTRAFLIRLRDHGDGRLPWKRGCRSCRNESDTGIASFIERAMTPKGPKP